MVIKIEWVYSIKHELFVYFWKISKTKSNEMLIFINRTVQKRNLKVKIGSNGLWLYID